MYIASVYLLLTLNVFWHTSIFWPIEYLLYKSLCKVLVCLQALDSKERRKHLKKHYGTKLSPFKHDDVPYHFFENTCEIWNTIYFPVALLLHWFNRRLHPVPCKFMPTKNVSIIQQSWWCSKRRKYITWDFARSFYSNQVAWQWVVFCVSMKREHRLSEYLVCSPFSIY